MNYIDPLQNAALSGRRVSIINVAPLHHSFLLDLMSSPNAGGRMRFFGATPSPEEIYARLWEAVLAQFVVVSNETCSPIGLVVLSTPNFADRFCHLSVVGASEVQGTGLVLEGAVLMIEYAFRTWDFRKLYFDVLEPNLRQFQSATRTLLQIEGRLRKHHFMNGEYVDLLQLAMYRHAWHGHATLLRRGVIGHSGQEEPVDSGAGDAQEL